MRSFFILAFLLIAQQSLAQQIKLHGTVIDAKSLEKLLGVHVRSGNEGVTTDLDGNFFMQVNWSDTLTVTMVGFDTLQVIVKDTARTQSAIFSMKERTILLENVSVIDYYRANTILKLPEDARKIYRIAGVRYPKGEPIQNYRLGVGGVVMSPMTAVNRLVSKDYKQRKRAHEEEIERRNEDAKYVKAKKALYDALDAIGDDLDEYYMLDFLNFTGLTLDGILRRNSYELVTILKGQIDRYNVYRKEKLEANE